MNQIEKFFRLEEKKTTIKTEFIAGLTTFLAMAYILVVNPLTLCQEWTGGLTWGAVFTATAIAAIVGTLIMGLYANYPVALAPGMGMNAFFAFTITAPWGFAFSWQLGFASIVVSGILFLILSVSGIREAIINAIPQDLKYAVGAGIGLFIAFIGLQNAGIIVNNDAVLVSLGDLSNPLVLLAIIGLAITIVLYVLKVRAAIFYGMIITAVIGVVWRGILGANGMLTENLAIFMPAIPEGIVDFFKTWDFKDLFNGFISLPEAPKAGAFIEGFGQIQFNLTFLIKFGVVVFSLLFIDFFDTAGTLVSVGSRCGLINKDGKLEGSSRALVADASATVVGAMVGTSSTTSYVESLSGVEVGGRTGLTSVFTAMFFLIAILFSPLLSMITASVTAPALIFVGILMASQLGKINWSDIAISIPVFLTIIAMPLTYSIATGIAVGFIFYPITLVASKRHKEVSKIMYFLSLLFIFYFVITTIYG